ncbi:MAG TPA: ABC transporter substrate-binding protein, partial [Chloroflexota bacterium]|nr:ABC transporter substrate-binding protein [Chloroflexota bacterium]
KIVDYNGETAAITPLILAKQIDYATQAFPPDTERAITSKGIGIVRPPLGSGPAIYINFKKVPDLVSVQARQALAYAINRDQAATVSLGLSAKSCKYMAGISDSLAGGWVDAADLAKLNNYALDVAKAASMLTTLGFKKGSDGVYVGPSGAKMDFTLEVPAEYTDWSATAQNVAEQLTAFGFKITVKPVTYTQEPIDIDKGNVQLAIGPWGAGSPFPRYSFYNDMELHNPPVALGPGTGLFDLKLGVDFKSLINASGAGLDIAAQKKAVATAAVAFNSLLPVIPMWERYGNNVALAGTRVTGWPPAGDPIYKNSPYGDSFVTLMVVNGTLKGV